MPGVAVAQSLHMHARIKQYPEEKRKVLQNLLDLQESYKSAIGYRLMFSIYPTLLAIILLIASSQYWFIPAAIGGGILLWKLGTRWVKKAKKVIEEMYPKYPEEVKILKECYQECTFGPIP